MANRYLIASGNWSDASIWSATSGGAGGVGVPTASDYVNIDANYNVTVATDADAYQINHTNGTITVNSGVTLYLHLAYSSRNNYSRTLTLMSGSKLKIDAPELGYLGFYIDGTNMSLSAEGSLIEVNYQNNQYGHFDGQNLTFGDVRLNLGTSGSTSDVVNITGSPTFRSLIIQSKNSAAHTVNFDSYAIYVSKLVVIGSSSTNRLKLRTTFVGEYNENTYFSFPPDGSSYGQYVDLSGFHFNTTDYNSSFPAYMGSNSIDDGTGPPTGYQFLLQDPPKISTLVDPLTTDPASNSNWTVTGAVTKVTTGHDGGGYSLASGAKIVSTDTYDAVSSSIVFETNSVTTLTFKTWHDTHSLVANKYYRFNVSSGGTYKLENSNDGTSWSTVVSTTVDNPEIYNSMRLEFGGGTGVIGSINPSLISAPTVTTGSASSIADTTATLAGNVTSDGGATVTERGIVYATTANPTTANSKKTATGTTGSYSVNVTGLTAGTTYHYRAYAINSQGTSYGADQTFTTDDKPTVSSSSATSVTDTSAVLTGSIDATGGKNSTERGFVYGTSSSNLDQTIKDTGSFGTGAFTKTPTGLTETTTYYFKAYATNVYGTTYSTVRQFTTLKTPPVANFTTDVTSGDYKLLVHFTDTSTKVPTSWAWDFGDGGTSTTQNPQHTYQAAGQFTVKLTATNAGGSNAITKSKLITVNAVKPTVSTGTASNITVNSATLGGSITDFGGSNSTERGFNYGVSSSALTSNAKTNGSYAAGTFTQGISSLASNTRYYYQAYAINPAGTNTGTVESFTTAKADATASTGTAGSITMTGATISSSSIANPDGQTITEQGVVYATTQNPTTANSKKTATGSPFDAVLSGLTANTTYYARAYVTFNSTTNYGAQISFKTQGVPVTNLSSPANNGTTGLTKSQLEFAAVDPDNDKVTYQLQLNTTNSFTSPTLDVSSATDTGFTDQTTSKTDPFYSGDTVRYTLQTDLTRGSSYYWRVRAKDPNGSNTWGDWTSASKFTVTTVAPSISITGLSEIQDTSLKVTGNVTDTGGASVTEQGIVWSLNANPTVADNKVKDSGTTSPFTDQVTGLTASTTYHFRAYAINSAGTSYSSDVAQMTLQPLAPPTVTTADASNISDITAKVGGEVTLDGRETVTERGVVFSTNPTPTTADRKFTDISGGLGTYSGTITGLDASTKYYYRAYAINSKGTGYGDIKNFTTQAPFVPDEGDGHWTFSVSGSDAIVARDQATNTNSSANLPLEDLVLLENGKKYTLAVGDITSDNGDPKLQLEWYDGATEHHQDIPANSNYTFTYDTTYIHWSLRLFVTQGSVVPDSLTATFSDLYLAQEGSFSSYVDFIPRGLTEVKIINNEIVDKRRQDVIGSIYSKLLGFSYTPTEIDTEGLGWFEIGDKYDITDPDGNTITTINYDSKLTIDGGISEHLKGDAPDKTETDYSKAGDVTKKISNTQIQVDKQEQTIDSIVSDVYDDGGYIDEKFSQIHQDIDSVTTTVQGSGGVNLIKNSVMYAYYNLGYPESWTTYHNESDGTIVIQPSPESIAAGAVSGNAFILSDCTETQTIPVKQDASFIAEDDKTYYTLSLRLKKNTVGVGHIKLSNRNETHQIDLANGDSYYWNTFEITDLLPTDDHYDLELYSDSDAQVQFTDVILAPGKTRHEWTPAAGEVMNSSIQITQDGLFARSDQFNTNYTKLDALGLEVHYDTSAGSETVFSFNGQTTNVSKLQSDKEIAMQTIAIVPVQFVNNTGWAYIRRNNG